ncbi:Uncharacterised protein [Mycobacterium tuberculosis]|nr:hypothetical protein [Mycobacterium tuberculosis]CKN74765.1 Uncharacterised protein [Mycobacterium tuberculosis]
MAVLQPMPTINLPTDQFTAFRSKVAPRLEILQEGRQDLGAVIDAAVGGALSVMLGNIPLVVPNANQL